MEVTQLYEHVNEAVEQALGEKELLTQDLSNIVSVGDRIISEKKLDNYVNALVVRIGKVIFVSRNYNGILPKILRDKWEYGLAVEKIHMELPKAQPNESWELRHGASYDTNIFYQPKIKVRFWSNLKTFEVPISVAEKQVKMSFTNATQLNSFVSMIYQYVENAVKLYVDELIRNTIANFIGITLKSAYGETDVTTASFPRAVNLLYLYNKNKSNKLTVSQALENKDFLLFATIKIRETIQKLKEFSTLFNNTGSQKFTPTEYLHVILLNTFVSKQLAYLESDVYHNELVKLPYYDEINFWQGTGSDFEWDNISKIDIVTSNGDSVSQANIIGVMFDRDALGISNLDYRTPGGYNFKAEFYTYLHKVDAGFWNDPDENFIVFFMA